MLRLDVEDVGPELDEWTIDFLCDADIHAINDCRPGEYCARNLVVIERQTETQPR